MQLITSGTTQTLSNTYGWSKVKLINYKPNESIKIELRLKEIKSTRDFAWNSYKHKWMVQEENKFEPKFKAIWDNSICENKRKQARKDEYNKDQARRKD